MELLRHIGDLPFDNQVNGCGESIIPFIHKVLVDDSKHYKCTAKIGGRNKTISTIIIDCHYINPRMYMPDYFEEWINDFIKSDNTYMILNIGLCNVYKNHGHSNCLIINKTVMTVERFEPRGRPIQYYDDLRIENSIKEFVKTYFIGFDYLSPYVFIGDEGPQTKTNLMLDLDIGRGLCVNYTILYIYLRCKEKMDPQESIKFINANFLGENLLKFTNYVNSLL